MERHIKKLAEQQAIRATSTQILSSWLSKPVEGSGPPNICSTRPRESNNTISKQFLSDCDNKTIQSEHHITDATSCSDNPKAPSLKMDSNVIECDNHDPKTAHSTAHVPSSPSKDMSPEPAGVEEATSHEEIAANSSTTRRRRLQPVSLSESDSDEGIDNPNVASENHASFLEDVPVTNNDEGDEDEVQEPQEKINDSDNSEDENVQKIPDKVNVEDFDDWEEFLLAGGEMEEAKKRKEWGLQETNHEEDDSEKIDISMIDKDVSVSKENLRKLQRESERLLRERRCMIPPAPVARRTFGDLVEKINTRVAMLRDKSQPCCNPAFQPEIFSTKYAKPNKAPINSFSEKDDFLKPPIAPIDEDHHHRASPDPSGLKNDDDLEDDELVIIHSKTKIPEELHPTAKGYEENPTTEPNFDIDQGLTTVTHKRPVKLQVTMLPRRAVQYSPPKNNAQSQRKALCSAFLKSAQQRSDHLSKLNQGTPRLQEDSISSKVLELARDPVTLAENQFIPSFSFVGSKSGYIFKTGDQGIGYYRDDVSLPSTIDLQPPMEDLPECACMERKFGEVGQSDRKDDDFESQALVLEYDDHDVENEFKVAEQGCNELSQILQVRDVSYQTPHRTYGRKDRAFFKKLSPASLESTIKKNSAALDTNFDSETRDLSSQRIREEFEDPNHVRIEAAEDADNEEQEGDALQGDEDESDKDQASDSDEADSDDEKESSGDEAEVEMPDVPVKKTLADITSIKRQTTLRLGTMEAGYLRTEQEALGIHEDIGVAEEDLGEGIDLDNTDGEGDSEEEDENSEEERKVAEGFLEDAKYSGETNPELLRQAHMMITEEDEKKMTEKILEVVRGDSRRRKAAQENSEWIPNRGMRTRLFQGSNGDFDAEEGRAAGDDENDLHEEQEEEAARIAAALAKDRLERMRFAQQKRELEKESSGDDADFTEPASRPAPMVRKVSSVVPSLAEFGRKLSGAVEPLSSGIVLQKRGSSLLGSGLVKHGDSADKSSGTISSGKVFFFDTKQRSTEGNDPLCPPDSLSKTTSEASMTRKRSDGSWNLTSSKMQRTNTAPCVQRSVSLLRQNLENL